MREERSILKPEAARWPRFVLLGGAHGFDGMDDADGRFFAEVLRLCEDRVGASNVAKVTLAEDASVPFFALGTFCVWRPN